jgi:16S rRNA (adenine1518-N6/adenine1519-N6)-dimethyltransferase
MRAKQSLGQNFLMHQATADRIADTAGLTPESIVLEIGPGTGMLTRALLARAGKVIAVEADRELIPELETAFAGEIQAGKFELLEGDIRSFDLSHLPDGYVVVANIPYYITGEIIRTLLSAEKKPSSVTLLVQKEVAERIVRSKKESLLSLSVKVYGMPTYAFTVPRGAFVPAPKVDSAVLHITGIRMPFETKSAEARFFEVLHAGFAHKRKRLAKNLEMIASSETITRALTEAGIGENARAEDVPLAAWRIIAGIL